MIKQIKHYHLLQNGPLQFKRSTNILQVHSNWVYENIETKSNTVVVSQINIDKHKLSISNY